MKNKTNIAKKIISLLFAVLLTTSIFIVPISLNADAATPDTINWTFDSETGTLIVSGNGPMEDIVSSEVDSWTKYADNIKEVYIEEGITSIIMFAFSEHKNLEKVTISSTVKTIGMQAFQGCTKLESIIIPDGVVELESNVFSFCPIKTVSIGKGLTDLDPTAFDFCTSLESFEVSEENPVFSSEDGVLFNKDKTKLIQYPIGNKRTEYAVPEGVKIIESESFMDASALMNITLPESVTYIGGNPFGGTGFFENEANWTDGLFYINDIYLISASADDKFSGTYEVKDGTKVIAGAAFIPCEDLTSIIIPASVISVGEAALRCEELSEIIVDEKSEYLTSIDGVLFTKDMSEIVCYPMRKGETSYEIPSGVKKIAKHAFVVTSLTEIVIPEGVTEIDEYAFATSQTLSKVTFPDSLISIGYCAFYHCQALESADFGSKLQIINDHAFDNCRELVSVKFSEGIKKIGEFSFYSCGKLESVNIPDSIKEIDRMAFAICYALKSVTVGVNSEAESNLYSVKPSETIIGLYAFNGCENLTSAVVNAKIIGCCAFAVCDALETVTLFDSLKSISCAAFAECNNISDIYYYGTENSWNNVVISDLNEALFEAEFYAMRNSSENKGVVIEYGNDCFGNLDNKVTLNVEETNGEKAEEMASIIIQSFSGVFPKQIYNISPVDDLGRLVQPLNGKVTVKIKLSENNCKAEDYIVFHWLSDTNELKSYRSPQLKIESINGSDYLVFEVAHFSYFAVCVANNEPDTPSEKTVSSISIASLPAKTSYIYRMDSLDLSGLALTVTYSDGTTENVTDKSKMKVTGFDNSKTGEQTVTVEYEGLTAEFNVNVKFAWWQWIIRILLLGFLWY